MTNPGPRWRPSSYCANGACIEVADLSDPDPLVLVRDSKLAAGGDESTRLSFTPGGWSRFIDAVRSDEFRPGP